MKVFLSHSHKDLELAKNIKEFLKLKCEIYIASEDYQLGQPLPQKIEKNIKSSSYLIVLITRDGAESDWVNQEIGIAKGCKIPIIPIVEKGIKPPAILEGLEYLQLDRRNPEDAIKKLFEFLGKKSEEKTFSNILTLAFLLIGIFLLSAEGK